MGEFKATHRHVSNGVVCEVVSRDAEWGVVTYKLSADGVLRHRPIAEFDRLYKPYSIL